MGMTKSPLVAEHIAVTPRSHAMARAFVEHFPAVRAVRRLSASKTANAFGNTQEDLLLTATRSMMRPYAPPGETLETGSRAAADILWSLGNERRRGVEDNRQRPLESASRNPEGHLVHCSERPSNHLCDISGMAEPGALLGPVAPPRAVGRQRSQFAVMMGYASRCVPSGLGIGDDETCHRPE